MAGTFQKKVIFPERYILLSPNITKIRSWWSDQQFVGIVLWLTKRLGTNGCQLSYKPYYQSMTTQFTYALMLPHASCVMMTSSNGSIFRVTGHLCGEFAGDRWIHLTKASYAALWLEYLTNKPHCTLNCILSPIAPISRRPCWNRNVIRNI